MQKIYLETSVISYFVSERSENIRIAGHQISTINMWKTLPKYNVFISSIVVDEASKGNIEQAKLRLNIIKTFKVLEINTKTRELAKFLVSNNAIPEKYPEDALHIAVASVNNIGFIVTWNFKHINNPFMKNKIRETIENFGYKCPIICSPEELLGESHE